MENNTVFMSQKGMKDDSGLGSHLKRNNAPYKVVDSDSFIDMINDLISSCDVDSAFLKEFNASFGLGESFDVYVVGIFSDLIVVVEKWHGDGESLPSRKESRQSPISMSTFHPSHEFYEKWDYNSDRTFFNYYVNVPSMEDTHRLDSLGACISL